MPISTNLNRYPYHDDHDPEKDFAKILFLPGISVQTRELIQLQTLLQQQVERFGDSVFKRGTIVEGCNFIFKDSFPYAKIEDTELDGTNSIPSSYVGLFARNADGLIGYVQSYQDGFEATSPDLKTVYVRYINSGDDGETFAFSPGDTLTLSDAENSLFRVRVDNGGVAFSNTDQVIVTPAVVVNVSTGTFAPGEYVTQDNLSSNLQIDWVDDTTLALSGQVILGLKPRVVDLANAQVNSAIWSLANSEPIRNIGNTAVASVEGVLGQGAEGGVVTDASGRILRVVLSVNGFGYVNTPHVTVRSANNSGGINAAELAGLNYRARVKIADPSDSVGNGYAFSVTEGVIYQKGYFLRVAPQTVIVSKYDQVPDKVAAIFNSVEDIVAANQDPSLNDPLVGLNYNAPGADRLRIRPELRIVDTADIRPEDDFFPIVEWSEGLPAKVNQVTVYSRLGDEMARARMESDGDFVVDRFEVVTRSPSDPDDEGTKMDVVVDPGLGYVDGYRVETVTNYVIPIDKGVDSSIEESQSVTLGYGSYVRVRELGGSFQFGTADLVSLRGTAKQYLTTSPGASITAAGSEIGTARMRSLVYESGVPGTPSAIYRLYLFDVRMNTGKNFRQVRSIFYNGTNKGVADADLELDPTTEANVAVLKETGASSLLFYSGARSLRNANQATYVYRTNYQTAQVANTGILTRSLASNPDEFFLRSGVLTDDEAQDLIVVPLSDLRFSTALTGTVSVGTATPNGTGTSTSFIADLDAGDYVYISGNSIENAVSRVVSVVNNTVVVFGANLGFTNTAAVVRRVYPANVPVPFGRRAGLSANVDSNGNIITLDFGGAFTGSAAANVSFSYDVERRDVDTGVKQARRNRFVRLSMSGNEGGVSGPWCVGWPDVIRLRGVYLGTTSGVSNTDPNVVDEFLIDANQTQDYLDLGWLYKKPNSGLTLDSGSWLLVEFDHLETTTPGFMATPSYVSANAQQVANVDSSPLSALGTEISSHEVPEVYSAAGKSFNLLSYLDFRPSVVNTAVSATTSGASTVDPSSTVSFGATSNPANDKRFPSPGLEMRYTAEQYLGRRDAVIAGSDGAISVLRGVPAADPRARQTPNIPRGTMLLDVLGVPPYPTLPSNPSPTLQEILLTRRINERGDLARVKSRTSASSLDQSQRIQGQPTRFTQRDIGSLSRRVAALEYYTSLSILETNMKDKVIPSSVDPTLDRFKFGFFVDDYSTETHLETSNPQHAASLEDDKLVPKKMTWTVVQDPGPWQVPPYVDHLLVGQDYATENVVPVPVPNTQPNTTPNTQPNTVPNVVPNCVITQVVSNTILLVKNPDNSKGTRYPATSFDYGHTEVVEMGNVAGPVTLYFDNHQAADRLVVYRGNTVFRTANDSVVLSASEKTLIKGNTYSQWFKEFPGQDRTVVNGEYWKGCGKITWNHNPSLGRTYTITVGKGAGSWLWRWALQYPVTETHNSCDPAPPPPDPVPDEYAGIMKFTTAVKWAVLYPYGSFLTVQFTDAEQKQLPVEVNVTGLKPSTKHTLKVQGVIWTDKVTANGKLVLPATLTSDAEGKMKFGMTFDISGVSTGAFFIGSKTFKVSVEAPHSAANGAVTAGFVYNPPPEPQQTKTIIIGQARGGDGPWNVSDEDRANLPPELQDQPMMYGGYGGVV